MSFREKIQRIRDEKMHSESKSDKLEMWRGEIERLYAEIFTWLSDYIDEGVISVTQVEKTDVAVPNSNTENCTLDIEIGEEIIRIDPRGTSVIGARGRADMFRLGEGEPIILALTGEGRDLKWNIVDSKTKSLELLTKQSFEDALDKLIPEYERSSTSEN